MKLERLFEEMLAEYDRRAEFYEIVLKADVLKLLRRCWRATTANR